MTAVSGCQLHHRLNLGVISVCVSVCVGGGYPRGAGNFPALSLSSPGPNGQVTSGWAARGACEQLELLCTTHPSKCPHRHRVICMGSAPYMVPYRFKFMLPSFPKCKCLLPGLSSSPTAHKAVAVSLSSSSSQGTGGGGVKCAGMGCCPTRLFASCCSQAGGRPHVVCCLPVAGMPPHACRPAGQGCAGTRATVPAFFVCME